MSIPELTLEGVAEAAAVQSVPELPSIPKADKIAADDPMGITQEMPSTTEILEALVEKEREEKEGLKKELGIREKTDVEKRSDRMRVIEAKMQEAIKCGYRLAQFCAEKWSDGRSVALWGTFRDGEDWNPSNDRRQVWLQFSLKVYDELKVAEEAEKEKEKPKRTEKEIRDLASRALCLIPVTYSKEVQAALAGPLMTELLK